MPDPPLFIVVPTGNINWEIRWSTFCFVSKCDKAIAIVEELYGEKSIDILLNCNLFVYIGIKEGKCVKLPQASGFSSPIPLSLVVADMVDWSEKSFKHDSIKCNVYYRICVCASKWLYESFNANLLGNFAWKVPWCCSKSSQQRLRHSDQQ